MEKAELLADFQARVDQFAKYHGFIEKTRAQADKFAKSVVEKVIADNIAKRDAVVAELIPAMADVEAVIADFERQKRGILEGQQGSRLKLEEMELRKAIGEVTDADFDQQTKDLQADLAKGNAQIAELDGDLSRFRAAMDVWTEIGTSAGVLNEVADEPEDAPEEEADDELEAFGEADDDDEPAPPPAPRPQSRQPLVIDESQEIESVDILEPESDVSDDVDVSAFHDDKSERVRFEAVGAVDDVSVVFADEDPADAEDEDEDDEEDDEDEDSASGRPSVRAGLKLEVGDVDTLLDDDLEQVEERQEDRPRRAVMLYQEGTAEEQIHPFTADVLTLGRGRDNDIQVKNDSKVSRYHCKLYRKSGNFYIEDNKSANGTLVNGELITERRLFGGEEIIIGETFFRFRIMD